MTPMFRLALVLLTAPCWGAQSPAAPPAEPATPARQAILPPAPDKPPAPEATAGPAGEEINLLGKTNTDRGESRRNENVQFNLIDNNVLKELNVRLGATATIVEEFKVDQRQFGSEFGAPPTPGIHPGPAGRAYFHGSLAWLHSNSVFSARSFFQVGPVRPAHENNYQARVGGSLLKGARFLVTGALSNIRGNVNGNVLIPLPEERTPLATDPELAAIVRRYLNAYPNEAPNRPDIGPRAHNTNSLQRIDTHNGQAQIDQRLGARDVLRWQYAFTSQSVDAFQFVVGQNPDTDNRNHRARINWSREWSPQTVTNVTAGFDRLTNLLAPAAGAVGPVMISMALTTLGPSPPIPIDRI